MSGTGKKATKQGMVISTEKEMILRHVSRYRLTTIDAVHACFYEGQAGRDAARKALTRLCDSGHLQKAEIHNRNFYRLTSRGVAMVNAPRRAAEIPGALALRERYAVLCFCTLRPGGRMRMTPAEMAEAFPALLKVPGIDPAMQHFFFVREGGMPCFGRAVVDCGAEVATLIEKCRTYTARMLRSGLDTAAEQGRFSVTLLTPYSQKADAVRDALGDETIQIHPSLYRVEVIPEMRHLGA